MWSVESSLSSDRTPDINETKEGQTSTPLVISMISAAVAAVGLLFSAISVVRNSRAQRIGQVFEVLDLISKAKELSAVFYDIDYNRFQYPTTSGTSSEVSLDRILYLLETLARRCSTGLLRLRDLEPVTYHYLVVFRTAQYKGIWSSLGA